MHGSIDSEKACNGQFPVGFVRHDGVIGYSQAKRDFFASQIA